MQPGTSRSASLCVRLQKAVATWRSARGCKILMEALFSFESVIRGYHVYKDTWESCIGEELVCKPERHNVYGPFAVAVTTLLTIYRLLAC